jgi:nucleoside-diphosphate-sugar epimerase
VKIAVIGANGFVGTRLCESLVLEGRHSIRPLLRSPGSLARLARFRLDDWKVTNALDPDVLARDLEGCDALVHGMVGRYDDIPLAARMAAQACARRGIRLVYLSSASVHGQSPAPGTDESTPITDRQPLPYNVAKVRAEQAIAQVRGAQVCVLRPSIVFGPRSQWTTGFARRLVTGTAFLVSGGPGICNSIYVDNLVHAIRIGLEHPRACEGPFYVADAEALTWREFVRPIVEGFGYSMEAVHDVSPVGPPAPGLNDRVRALRKVTMARQALGRVPRRIKDALRAGIERFAAGAPPSPFALPRTSPPVADFEMSQLHTCATRLSMAKARSVLGYAPAVSVHEGLRRSVEFLLVTMSNEGAAGPGWRARARTDGEAVLRR